LELEDKQYSPGVVKEMVWLSGAMGSFGEAEQVFHRVGHMCISDSSIWRRKERWGERFKALEEAGREKANRLARGTSLGERMVEPEKRVGVSMDGTMVHILEEGWKELKVGCAFDVDVRTGWNEGKKEWEEWAHAANNHYVAHLGGPEMLGQLLWAEAQRQGWEWARDREVVGDGASWVWKVSSDHFFEGREVVDWYHAMEHLSGVGALLHGEGTDKSKRWYRSAQTAVYQGHAGRIAWELKEAASGYPEGVGEEIRREAGYLDKHKRRMQYLEMREEGYVIGSGMVESGGKQFKGRFCGPGMRWSRAGIERLIPIRAAIMSDRFDTTWKAAYNSPPS
jgi:hypothetical protein